MTRRELVLIALRRGVGKRCPHCGEGSIFSGWAHHLERCAVCGLVYERNPGDTWAFTIFGDRLPIAVIIVLIYFGIGRSHPLLGSGATSCRSIGSTKGSSSCTRANRSGRS